MIDKSRFWAKVNKTKTCWLWTGCVQFGYGLFGVKGRARRAHRVCWELFNGPIPEGKVLDHLCRIRNCVNPSHLEVVDSRTNILRGVGKAAINARKVRCHKGHVFDLENTYLRRGGRDCRKCGHESMRKWREKRKYREECNK